MATTTKLAKELETHYRFLPRNHAIAPSSHTQRAAPIVPSHAPSHYLFAVLLTLIRATIQWDSVELEYSCTRPMPPLANRWHPSLAASSSRADRAMLPHSDPQQEPIDENLRWGGKLQAPGFDHAGSTPGELRLRLLCAAEDHLAVYAYRFQILSQEPFVRAVEYTIAHLIAETIVKGEHYTGWLTWPFVLPEYDGTLKMGGWTKGTTAWEDLDHEGDVVIVKEMELVLEMIASPMEPSTADDDAEPTNNTQLTNNAQPTNATESRVIVGSVNQDDIHLPPPAGTASRVQQIAADKYGPWSPKRRRASRTETEPLRFSKRRKKSRLGMECKYWTVGEVGNHCSDTDRWALVEDQEGGFQVQDVTGVLPEFVIRCKIEWLTCIIDHPFLQTKHGLEKYTEMTQHGLVLHQDAHKWTMQNPSLGLLIMGKELQEMFEMDGQDGRPHWVYAGGSHIYDLTGEHPSSSTILQPCLLARDL